MALTVTVLDAIEVLSYRDLFDRSFLVLMTEADALISGNKDLLALAKSSPCRS